MTAGYAQAIGSCLGPDTHANRPATTNLGIGTMFVCTTHGTIEQVGSDGQWWTWYTPPASQAPDLSGYQLRSEEGQPNGYAPLDQGGKVPAANLPTVDLSGYQQTSQKNQPSGYVGLDASSRIVLGGDTYLYRSAAGVLKTDGELDTGTDVVARVGAAAQQVIVGNMAGNAGLRFGTAQDTSLYRSSAGYLTTPGGLIVAGTGGTLQVLGSAGVSGYSQLLLNIQGSGLLQVYRDGNGFLKC